MTAPDGGVAAAGSIDEQLGWKPIPAIPEVFRPAVVEGQRLLERVVREQDRDALTRLADVWDAIVIHPDFGVSDLSFRLALLNRSGVALNWRGQGRSSDADIERAKARFTAALAESPPGWPDRSRYRFNLGIALTASFAVSGNRPELEAAVNSLEQAVREVDPEDAALASLCRYGLADALAFRLRVLGVDGDLDRAVGLAEDSVRFAPPGSSNLPRFRSRLATILGQRYDVAGSLDDLHRAIELLHANLDAAGGPALSSAQAGDLNNLGDMLRRRYLRTRQLQDLEDAISFQTRSLELSSPTEAGFAVRLNNLGNSLLEAFGTTHDVDLLRRAVDAHEQSVARTSSTSHYLPARLNNLGNSLTTMYEQTGDAGYLDRAIVDYERAVEITAPAAPERPSRSYNLGNALLLRHARTGRRADRRASQAAYRAACQLGLNTSPEWALSAARAWGGWASSRRDWRKATEAYGFGLEAMRRLFEVQLVREDKEAWLRSAAGLSSQASFALAQRRSVRDAASVLEQGRAMLLSEQLEQHRTDLRQLAIDHPDLAARYRTAVGDGGAASPGGGGDATFA